MTDEASAGFSRLSGVPQAYFDEMQHAVPNSDLDALRVFLALRAAARRIDNAVAEWLERDDLTATKLDVLHLLRSNGPLGVTQMSEFLRMTQPNVTYVVNGLERDGLIERTPSVRDRRASTLALTRRGRRLLDTVTPRHLVAIAAAMARIAPDARARLVTLLADVTEGFEGARDSV